MKPRAILYRIIGNELPPRHCAQQSLSDLQFILAHEQEFSGLEKRWLLNRIVDQKIAERYASLIENAGHQVDWIPFDQREYWSCWADIGDLPLDHHPWQPEFKCLEPTIQAQVIDYVSRSKNVYVMNNNGARNRAVELGLRDAPWVLPWDSGCFLSPRAWASLEKVMRCEDLAFLNVPMVRLECNDLLLADPQFVPRTVSEPQLCFSRAARFRFDERLRYGSMSKAALLRRLAIPGEWHQWHRGTFPWENVDYYLLEQAGSGAQVGWVFRLNQPQPNPDHTNEAYLQKARFDGINTFIRELDKRIIRDTLCHQTFFFWTRLNRPDNCSAVSEVAAALQHAARSARQKLCPPLAHKVVHASEDPTPRAHYMIRVRCEGDPDAADRHQLPPWQPISAFGTLRAPAEEEDRERWRDFCKTVCILALDYHLNNNQESVLRAADLLRCWFVDPETSMVPALAFGRSTDYETPVCLGKQAILELHDLPPLLDALRIVRSSGALMSFELQCLDEWLGQLLLWLGEDSQEIFDQRQPHHLQVWYHVLVVSLSFYLFKRNLVAQVLDNLSALLARQCLPGDATSPAESVAGNGHAAWATRDGWCHLIVLCSALGRNLLSYRDQQGRDLTKLLEPAWPSEDSFARQALTARTSADSFWWDELRSGSVGSSVRSEPSTASQSAFPFFWPLIDPHF